MTDTAASGRTRLPYLSADAFVSQTDRAALQNLQKVPLLPVIIRKFNEFAVDRVWYVLNSADSVRCGPKQFPTVYGLLQEACEILHVPEPELYIRYSPVTNAYTSGMGRTFMVLNSSLVDSFTDDELRFIIGHELGHIKCGHVLYLTIGFLLIELLRAVGEKTLGIGQMAGLGLLSAFYEWMRQAEVSCDRAGLLVCQDTRTAFTAIMKLGCGGTRHSGEMDVDAFLEQARSHSESAGLEGAAKVLTFLVYNWMRSHPQVVYRAKGLDEWVRSGAYEAILTGNYARDVYGSTQMGAQVRCPGCKTTLSATTRFCPKCGENLKPAASGNGGTTATPATCRACGDPLAPGVKFCANCGTPVAAPEIPIPFEEEEPI